ncbi:MAG TPA: 3-oxoacyl-[acyl-carrier-protein] synthase III C-terminal domain-containing protein [Chthonomonadaceae bacterium]|nr:3-oxoacyl-[acyl-carrier-protein] synthase III C-terminal domain-containing protein [Chthonomonadaceae bacterium]
MPYILATSTATPSYYYKQQELADALRNYLVDVNLDFNDAIIDRLFCSAQIYGRYFALPLVHSAEQPAFSAANAAGIEAALDLCESAVGTLLDQVGLAPKDIAQIASVSIIPTLVVPSLEARLMNRLPFRPGTKRISFGGMGCAGGAYAVGRMADYLKGHPEEAVMILSCEIVSVCWQGSVQRELADLIRRLPNKPGLRSRLMGALVTMALFGDGVAAVLMVGDRHPLAVSGGYEVVESGSLLTPDTGGLLGAEIVETGIRGNLHPSLPERARHGLRAAVDALLEAQGLSEDRVDEWILHPGGPKVMDALQEEFHLSPLAFQRARALWAQGGNVESASVLLILDRILAEVSPEPGSYAILAAMGPGFCQEVSLLRWA